MCECHVIEFYPLLSKLIPSISHMILSQWIVIWVTWYNYFKRYFFDITITRDTFLRRYVWDQDQTQPCL